MELDPYLSGPLPRRKKFVRRRSWNLRYSEDQPRDPDGRFGSGGGGGDSATKTGGPSPAAIDARIEGLTSINVGSEYALGFLGHSGTFKGGRDVSALKGAAGGSKLATEYYVTSNGEHAIDGVLRHGGDAVSVQTAQAYAKDIEASMGRSRTDCVGYRGIVAPPGQEFKPGDSFTDKGLVSLSSDKGVATAFAEGRATGSINLGAALHEPTDIPTSVPKVAGTPTTLAVEIPKGSLGRTGEADIYETILPRDTTFHVIGTGSDGTVLVRAQEVGMP